MIYKKMRLCNIPTFTFYLLKSPLMCIHFLKSKITKEHNRYFEVLNILNTLRIECSNYDTVNEKGKHSLKCLYDYDNKSIYVKLRFLRKVNEEEYEKFRNSVDIHCDYGMSNLTTKKGYFHFVVYMKLESLYETSIDKYSMAIGTYHKGLLTWNYAEYPHILVLGETGQGKSVFIRYLLKEIFNVGYDVWCIDGKKIDYSKVKSMFKQYCANDSNKSNIILTLEMFKDEMQLRYDSMVQRGIYNYFEDESLEPVFLLIDEYLTIIETADKKEQTVIKKLVSEIIWLGRAAGYFLIVTMQRADAKYIDGAIRDNFACRVVVGKASKESYSMIFDRKLNGFEKGRAWVQINNDLQIISIPFYKDF